MEAARLVGGAGTGKTTELLGIMEKALEVIHDPLKLGLASFTRAARAEAAGRAAAAWGVEEETLTKQGWFRTVHSTVYRCLNVQGGQMLTGKQADIDWLSEAMGVRLGTELDDELGVQRHVGDPVVAASLDCWAKARATLRPLKDICREESVTNPDANYDAAVRHVKRYETAKRLHDRMDFTDILTVFSGIVASPEDGFGRCEPRGELPAVSAWLFDEQQDASPLLDAACRRLVSAESVRWCYVVGDPFQAIYGFAGSTSDCFMAWDVSKERTMPKSWRCPRPILELGERCLRRMRRGYWDRKIAPADHEGSVASLDSIEDAIGRVDPREDWLLIARTNYQATRLAAAMHEAGKPVRWTSQASEPSRRALGLKGLWSLEKGTPITGGEWQAALELLPQRRAGGDEMLTRGTKTKWKSGEMAKQWDWLPPSDLPKVGATEALVSMIASGAWAALVDRGGDWRREAERWGSELAATPRCRVGTIHSVKGAEADNVALLNRMHDEECRVAYVAVTRTRRNLCVIDEGKTGTPRMEVL
jgi:superfamily I DNA/RNA helicase